jgi:hypothetical protein
VDSKTLSLQYLDALKALGASPATKLVVPTEFTNLLRPLVEYTNSAATAQGTPVAGTLPTAATAAEVAASASGNGATPGSVAP